MPPGPTRADLAAALAAGVGGVAGSYAVAGFTPGFVAAPVGAALATTLPGPVVTVAILVLGDLGQQLNLLTAVLLSAGALAVAAGVGTRAGRGLDARAGPLAGGVLAGALAAAITGRALPAVGAGAAALATLAAAEVATTGASDGTAGRRRALGALAALAGTGAVGALVRAALSEREPTGGRSEAARELLAEAEAKSLDVEGIDPLVSEEFYEVDINPVNPDPDAAEWSLSVTGAVAREVTLGYEELRSLAAEHRFVTLRCVGEAVNGNKMDNALWTGVPASAILDRAVPDAGCECVMLRAADGYYEEFPLPALRDGLLAYGMNGRALPRAHGYPVRALVPGHWGEINVKWLTEIEVLERPAEGYWEKRGWHGTGPVNTVAKLHAVNHRPDGSVQVGGHAYAGLRGVSAVEVSTDGGDTWHQARLSDPLPGQDVWRQWAYEYEPPDRSHFVVARAVEADGTVQPEAISRPFPNGPSGWVSVLVSP